LYNLPFTGNVVTDISPDELITNTKSGTPRLNFKIAINEGERGDENEKSHFIPFTAFGSTAENFSKSLKKGMRVTIVGRLNSYEKVVQIDGEDKKLTMLGFTAVEGGPALRWATAVVTKAPAKGARPADSYAGDEEAAPAPRKAAPAKAAPKAKAAAADDDNDF
jgi:single-strand DNA-binding protein